MAFSVLFEWQPCLGGENNTRKRLPRIPAEECLNGPFLGLRHSISCTLHLPARPRGATPTPASATPLRSLKRRPNNPSSTVDGFAAYIHRQPPSARPAHPERTFASPRPGQEQLTSSSLDAFNADLVKVTLVSVDLSSVDLVIVDHVGVGLVIVDLNSVDLVSSPVSVDPDNEA